MRRIDIGGKVEEVVERSDYPPDAIRRILAGDTIAILGYGVQGKAQSLNLRDNGLPVIVGVRPDSSSWNAALADDWRPGETLLSLEEASDRGNIILYLLSDAGQKDYWPRLKPRLTSGKALVFAHGFSIVFADQTGVIAPAEIDVLLIAPRGSGTTFRRLFLEGQGLNAGFAVHQDATGQARERCLAVGVGIGLCFLYETTFEREVYGDLVGERGSLLGAIYGLWLAQYEVLRSRGHTPAEAFNETVEEATQSLYPLIGEKGMEWMYANCSTTAQRGALDWFGRFRDAVKPVFEELYDNVANGSETRRTLDANGRADYRAQLERELAQIAESEMWQAGRAVRSLRHDKE